jgi:hypothetical protein
VLKRLARWFNRGARSKEARALSDRERAENERAQADFDTLFPGSGGLSTSIWERRTDDEYRRQ